MTENGVFIYSFIMTDCMVMRSSICEELRLECSKELEGISHVSFITYCNKSLHI